MDAHLPVGSTGSMTVKLTGPQPIVYAELQINDRPTVTLTADDLRAGTWTLLWTVSVGVSRVNVLARDRVTCQDRTGLPRTVTAP